MSFRPDSKECKTGCVCAIEMCINAVQAWMIKEKMKLKYDKTEFLIIASKQQLEKVHIDKLTVESIDIHPV